MEIVNAELVAKITEIVGEWSAADAVAQTLPSWTKLAARAGIEKVAMRQIGRACESIAADLGVSEGAEWEEIGEAAFSAYKNGAVKCVLDIARQ